MNALARGLYVTALLGAAGTAGAAKWLLGKHWLPLFGAASVGMAAGILLLFVAQYYTEHRYRPVREIAEAARLGPSLALLRGVSAGLESALWPVLIIAAAVAGAHLLGARTGLDWGGAYGIAIATRNVFGDDSLGFALTRPMHIYSGTGLLTAATGADAMGNLTIGHGQVDFAESTPETDLEVGYTRTFMEGRLTLQSDAAYQLDVGGQTGRNAATFVTRLKLSL